MGRGNGICNIIIYRTDYYSKKTKKTKQQVVLNYNAIVFKAKGLFINRE